jgi:hypothetical protein
MWSLLCSVVRGGVEPPPATYQIAMLPLQHRTVGKVGVEPTISCSQGTRGAVPLHPAKFFVTLSYVCLPPSAYGLLLHDPCGIRTRPAQLERLMTSPEVERAAVTPARTPTTVGREALESSSPGFQPSAIPSQLPTQRHAVAAPRRRNKKARCPCDTGPVEPVVRLHGRASQAQWLRGHIPCERHFPLRGKTGPQHGITRTSAFLDRTRSQEDHRSTWPSVGITIANVAAAHRRTASNTLRCRRVPIGSQKFSPFFRNEIGGKRTSTPGCQCRLVAIVPLSIEGTQQLAVSPMAQLLQDLR